METAGGWLSDWDRLIEVALGALFFFVAVVFFVRILGKRTTGQMNNFDWIITVTVGALAAGGILDRDVSVLDSLLAIVVLGLLQYATTLLVLRSERFARVVRARPTLLLHKGVMLDDALRHTRVSPEELCSALRQNGIADLKGANWVILETNGELTVIPQCDKGFGDSETMRDVMRPDRLPD